MGLFSSAAGPGQVVTEAGDAHLPVALRDVAAPTRAVARREAVIEAGSDRAVGPMLDVFAGEDHVVTMRFEARVKGYRGWRWSVTVALIDPLRPTVSEVVLLPGPDALVAPEWVPWQQRVRAGDLGVGDVLLTAADDERVVPAYLQSDDPAVEEVAHELGVGRVRVLSLAGRQEAARRWNRGGFGPMDDMARHAPAPCATCAFYQPVAGSLGVGFGVCTNELSPADGRVVDVGYGCGAHSEATVRRRSLSGAPEVMVDELQLEIHGHQPPTADGAPSVVNPGEEPSQGAGPGEDPASNVASQGAGSGEDPASNVASQGAGSGEDPPPEESVSEPQHDESASSGHR